ncbi:hypothetical protein [Arenibaculum pallidiluteum]|uniref:hypothetical protein n=1 Tax=Arenibaculum pallidiluteum TaxID=2812559 RepID=UPI001A96453D|nr:hypothetical protein [Arenibaculum pallidiluteum]
MSKIVAIKGWEPPSKQEALLFDEIVVFQTEKDAPEVAGLKEFLIESGIARSLYGKRFVAPDPASVPVMDIIKDIRDASIVGENEWGRMKDLLDLVRNPVERATVTLCLMTVRASEPVADLLPFMPRTSVTDGIRAAATVLKLDEGIDATCLLNKAPAATAGGDPDRRQRILEILLTKVPVPSDLTPWEQIIDFRKDEEARARFWGLKRWMNKMVRDSLPLAEIEDEIDYLLHEYESHMKLHGMKCRTGVLRTLVSFPFEVAENVVKLKWKDIADIPFKVCDYEIALTEAEMKAPGRELSYLVEAKKAFPDGP